MQHFAAGGKATLMPFNNKMAVKNCMLHLISWRNYGAFLTLFLVLFSLKMQAQQVEATKSVNNTNPQSGETIIYTIDFGCSGLETNCEGAKIVDQLPVGLVFDSSPDVIIETSAGTMTVPAVYDAPNHTLTWDFTTLPDNGIKAGVSAAITINVSIPEGTIADGSIFTNVADLTSDNAGTANTSVDITVGSMIDWELTKSVTSGPIYHDMPVTYEIELCSNSNIGNVNLDNVVITDDLPAGADFVSANNGGVWNTADPGQVTWNLGNLNVASGCTNVEVEVVYPSSDGVNNDTGLSNPINKKNIANLNANSSNGPVALMDMVNRPLLPPNFQLGIVKRNQDGGILPLEETNHFSLGVSNGSTVAVEDFTVLDNIPPQFDLTGIQLSDFGPMSMETVDILVELNNSGVFTTWQSSIMTSSDVTFDASTIPAYNPPADYISAVRFDFGTVSSGFGGNLNVMVTPAWDGMGAMVDNLGNPVDFHTKYDNCVELTATNPLDLSVLGPEMSCDNMCYVDRVARVNVDNDDVSSNTMTPSGSPTTGNPYLIGSEITYMVHIENDGSDDVNATNLTGATGLDILSNPVGANLLPAGVTYIPNTWIIVSDNTGLGFDNSGTNPTFEIINDYNSTGRTLLRWNFTGDFNPGGAVDIAFQVEIDASTAAGTNLTNNFCVSSNSDFICEQEDCGETTTSDLANYFDAASAFTETCCRSNTITVADSLTVPEPQKTIISSGPYAPTQTDPVLFGQANDTIEYEITVANNVMANVVLPNPLVMDLMPPQMEFVVGSLELVEGSNTTGLTISDDGINPTIELIQDFSGNNNTLLRLAFSGDFPIDSEVKFRYKVFIRPGAGGTPVNMLYMETNEQGADCMNSVVDTEDLDGDGNTTELLCVDGSPPPAEIMDLASLAARKFVKGPNDATFLELPDVASTNLDDSVSWRLQILNSGNEPLNNAVVYDIFPYIGDVGVKLNASPRKSEWRPFLIAPITVPPGMVLYYSQSRNPCRPEINTQLDLSASCIDDWSLTPPADLSTVEAIKVEIDHTMMPGEMIEFYVEMWSPASPLEVEARSIAWNSLARNADEVSDQEPNKVGIRLDYFDLALQKTLAPGQSPAVTAGEDVTFRLNVINQGSYPARNTLITDYVPPGMTFDPNKNAPEWTGGLGETAPTYLLTNLLQPGETAFVDIVLTVDAGAVIGDNFTNGAEITSSQNEDGSPADDPDSDEDNIPDNDGPANDDVVDNTNGDQDDHDIENVGVTDCTLNITDVTVGACFDNGTGASLVPVSVEVTWTDAPDGQDIEVTLGGITDIIDVQGGATSPTTITINAFADETTNNPIEAGFEDGICIDFDGDSYDAPAPCGSDCYYDMGLITTCNNNSTLDDNDDKFYISINPQGNGLGGSYTVSGDVDLTMMPYGENIVLGLFDIANGNVSITVTDDDDNSCEYSFIVNPTGPCSAPPDYGDLPDTYGTTDLFNGAVHNMYPDLYLGAGVDSDEEGQPEAMAGMMSGGDDNNLGTVVYGTLTDDDDEDGIAFISPLIPNHKAQISITAHNETGTDAVLQGWIDFNGDGFFEASEQLNTLDFDGNGFTVADGGATNQVACFTVPADATFEGGAAFCRFRLSSDGGLNFNGPAPIGEVEDYKVNLGKIGSYVWNDTDADGQQDEAATNGLENVMVQLEWQGPDGVLGTGDDLTYQVTTDADGIYAFCGIIEGDYEISIPTNPVGFAPTLNINTGDETTNSDDNTGEVISITDVTNLPTSENSPTGDNPGSTNDFPDNQDDLTYDFGFYIPASLGDYVWEDEDADGIQDTDEMPLENVEVTLYECTGGVKGMELATVYTDDMGAYAFTGLIPGEYCVEFDATTSTATNAATLMPTNPNDSDANETNDSDADANGCTEAVTLNPGDDYEDLDAGFFSFGKLGDIVWEDTNGNGIQDESNTGIAGLDVILTGTDGQGMNITPITIQTNPDGTYCFDDLVPGNYKVTFEQPEGMEITYADATNNGGDDTNDSDINDMLMTPTVTINSGDTIPDLDAGFFTLGKIGDVAWEDINGNGVQDEANTGIADLDVTLTGNDGQGNPISSVTVQTNVDGTYCFGDLVPGDYKVTFEQPEGMEITYADATDDGGDDTNDSDINDMLMTPTVTINSGDTIPDLDAGFFILGKLGDIAWEDLNGNGVQDETNTGIADLDVTLTGNDGQGNPISSVTVQTNADGTYCFGDLVPGDYKVTFEQPTGMEITYADATNDGGDDTNDSDINDMLMTPIVTINSGDTIPDLDAGFYTFGKIGDIVWEDVNGNGVQDEINTGIAGIDVTLTGNDGQGNPISAVTIQTNTDGTYCFGDLPPGDYKVTFEQPQDMVMTYMDATNDGGDDTNDSDINDMLMTPVQTIESGDTIPDLDAGFFQLGKIGDLVWEDVNGNGIQDLTTDGTPEPGIAEVDVTLTGNDGQGTPIAAITIPTNPDGTYCFDDLPPGDYKVTFEQPNGYEPTLPNDPANNGDDTSDSDADPDNSLMSPITTLESGDTIPHIDAGFYVLGKIGDFVWADYNANGIQDLGADGNPEPGILGVDVTLNGIDGFGLPIPSQTIATGVNGEYCFGDLVPGTYQVTFDLPTESSPTIYDDGDGNQPDDSDADPANGLTTPDITLASADTIPTLDAGFYQSDFGDNPDSFGTLIESDGASHVINPFLFLGTAVDPENTGIPTPESNGDTAEDGIVCLTPLVPGHQACIEVTTTNNTLSQSYLVGWMDFNGNGIFENEEQLNFDVAGVPTQELAIGNGELTAIYCFDIPTTATFDGGETHSRFRLSPEMGTTGTGEIIGGEIEDYYKPLAKVGNLVWRDYNYDGIQNEPSYEGFNDIEVELIWGGSDDNVTTADDNVTYSTTTANVNGEDGKYCFYGVVPGAYTIQLPNPPVGFESTLVQSTPNEDEDNNGVAVDFVIDPPFNLFTNENGLGDDPTGDNYPDNHTDLTFDFGFIIFDYGDLANNFATLDADNGAYHSIIPDMYLGKGVDAETDGAPQSEAGYDGSGGDDHTVGTFTEGTPMDTDEDGVVFTTPLIPGNEACVEVTHNLPTGTGVLNAWIDFNGDGDFDEGNEQIIFTKVDGAAIAATADLNMPVGTMVVQELCFDIPAEATYDGGETHIRFRFSENGISSPDGFVAGGEVEDYWIPFVKVGNYVWYDANFNGLQDEAAEDTYNGATVVLTWAGQDGMLETTDDRTYSTVSANIDGEDGRYCFLGLIGDETYKLGLDLPDDFEPTIMPGLDPNQDSNTPEVIFSIDEDVATQPIDEDGTNDNPSETHNYPDNQDNLTFDFSIVARDYGDLPNTFNTLMTEEGANHIINKDMYLGSCVDAELDGNPVPMAGFDNLDGDDNEGSFYTEGTCAEGDEDGIEFISPLIPGEEACIKATALVGEGTGVLNLWIDFNGDGDFEDDANEKVIFTKVNDIAITPTADAAIPNGNSIQKFCFDVPATATFEGGETHVRARLGTAGDMDYKGTYVGGEVEDYYLPLAKVGSLFWADFNVNDVQDEPEEAGLNGFEVILTAPGEDGILGNNDDVNYSTFTATVEGVPGIYQFCGLIEGDYQIEFVIDEDAFVISDQTSEDADSDGQIVTFSVGHLADDQPTDEDGMSDDLIGEDWPDNHVNATIDAGILPFDFGDLPSSFGNTLFDNDGARHVVLQKLYLGNCVDADIDGIEDTMSGTTDSGDDNTEGLRTVGTCTEENDDEDALRLTTPLIPGEEACLEITHNSQLSEAYINAWMDFDGDGTFAANGSEAIIWTKIDGLSLTTPTKDGLLPQGNNITQTFCFEVPISATFDGGETHIRLRASAAGGLAPTGIALEGEVEDYWLPLAKIGNIVWHDVDYDGEQDEPSNEGINDVTVELVATGADNIPGTSDDLTYTTTTSNMNGTDGMYMFYGLTAGIYTINVITPEDYQPTWMDNTGVDDNDNDGTGITFVVPDLITEFLPTNEDETGDAPGTTNNFPDTHDDLTLDFGFVALDYGDLPDSYGTIGASNGPVHAIGSGLVLGGCVDAEEDAAASTGAGQIGNDGDDNTITTVTDGNCTNPNDADGVRLLTPLIPGYEACIEVTSTAPNGDAMLNAWIDFDGDKTFEEVYNADQLKFTSIENVELNTPTTEGLIPQGMHTQIMCFVVPENATFAGGETYFRYRLSTDGGLDYTGIATDGEVEDYYKRFAKVGNLVWADTNADGSQDDEAIGTGINGVQLELVFTDENGEERVYETTSSFMNGANGSYMFYGLIEGDYIIRAIPPENRFYTIPNNTNDDETDHDDEMVSFTIDDLMTPNLPINESSAIDELEDPLDFPDNQTNLTFDFGFIEVSIMNMGGQQINLPCRPIGEGLFEEEVVITALPGQTWAITENEGFIDPNTGQPYPVGTEFIANGGLPATYSLIGQHADGVGYTLAAGSATFPNTVLSMENTCNYSTVTEGDDIVFENGAAIIEAQEMHCGTMTYKFYDSGGKNAPYEDTGDKETFTICPENPMTQRIVYVRFNDFQLEFERTYADVDAQSGSDNEWVAERRRHFIKRDVLRMYDGGGRTPSEMTDNDNGNGHRLGCYRENFTDPADANGLDFLEANAPGMYSFDGTNRAIVHSDDDGHNTSLRDFADNLGAQGNSCTNGAGCMDSYTGGPADLSAVGDDGTVTCHCIEDDLQDNPNTIQSSPENETVEFIYSLDIPGFDSGDDNGYNLGTNILPNKGDEIFVGKGDDEALNFDSQMLNDGTGCITFTFTTDGTDVASGWDADILVEEFAPAITCLPIVHDLNGDGDVADANETEVDGPGVDPSLNGNGIIEVVGCTATIPDQFIKVELGCGLFQNDLNASNPYYEYDVLVNGTMTISAMKANADPQLFQVDGDDLNIGNNEIEVHLYYNDGAMRSLKDECTQTLEVDPMQTLACNDELIIGLDSDCHVTITADLLLEAPCEEIDAALAYEITLSLEQTDPLFMNQQGITLPGIIDNGTNIPQVQVPGRYFYSVTLGTQSCWGEFVLEDKVGPVCQPAEDGELNIDYDIDCDGEVELNVNDPSGVDDLLDEYILCSIAEANGIEIYFDILEPMNLDGNNDGDFTDNGIDVLGDFLDCTGIDYVYFEDSHTEICSTDDLAGIPFDETRFDANEFEICDVYQRTWFAIDKNGDSSQGCSQYVFTLRPKAHRVLLDLDVSVDCSEEFPDTNPYFIVDGDIDNNGTGSEGPAFANDKVYELPSQGHSCKYAVSYHEDPEIPICTGSLKKHRHWTVVDWCDGSRIYDEFTQLIKIEDNTPPFIGQDANNDGQVDLDENGNPILPPTQITLNTDYYTCEAADNIPFFPTLDNCSDQTTEVYNVTIERTNLSLHDENVFVAEFENGGDVSNLELPFGTYEVIYYAADACGNESSFTTQLTLLDENPPIAICNDVLNVTLVNYDGTLISRVYGEDLDDTSFDNCFEIGFVVRSLDNASTNDNNWQEWVEFTCDDVTNEDLKVELLVYEDRNGDSEFIDNINNETGFPTPDGLDDFDNGISQTCWTRINVEDKDIPTIVCEDKTLNCNDVNLDNFRSNIPTEDTDGDGVADTYICPPVIAGGCANAEDINLSVVVFDIDYDENCKRGTFIRRWTATRIIDGMPQTAGCDQIITVDFVSDWTMTFPIDEVIECAEEGNGIPEPLAINEILDNDGCDTWGMEVEDEIYDFVGQDGDGACFKVVRTYKFTNWCTWDVTNTELAFVNRPEDLITQSSRAVQLRHRSFNLGRNDFGDENDADPYNEIISPIDITAAFPGPNPPATNIADDDGAMVLIDNDFQLGSDPQGTVFLFQRQYNENINDNDNVTGVYAENYGYFAYRQIIKVADTQAPVITPIADVMVGDTTGTCSAPITLCAPEIEECQPSYSTTYTVVSSAGEQVAAGNFPIGATPEDCVEIGDLALDTYIVTYLVEDNCGNYEEVSYTLMIVDKKAPTAYCIFGLSIDLMPGGMVEIWATDFDGGSFDSCSEPLSFSFDEDNTATSRIFTCEELGVQSVDMWVHDAVGNSAFCNTFVVIQPNPNQDGSTGNDCEIGGLVSGRIQTEMGDDVEGVQMSISGNMNVTITTATDGAFVFNEVEMGNDYTLTPEKDINALNGVSTFDLVLIRKHILGIELLDSPYKLIAADANRSQTITTFDMVNLRKLILNIDTELQNNTSWRFVDEDYVFPNPTNPWAEAFPEIININDFEGMEDSYDFVAVKVGDVNDSAIPNNLLEVEERSVAGTLYFETEEQQLEAGKTYTIEFKARDLSHMEGYQYTLSYDKTGLEIIDIQEGIAKDKNFGLFADKGIITTSWEGDYSDKTKKPVVFGLTFTAKTDAALSELLQISSEPTLAEAYTRAGERYDVRLLFTGTSVATPHFELYQNEPNPFADKTVIGFEMPKAGEATLTVQDASGKVLHQLKGAYEQGYNEITIDIRDFNATNMMYYRLETDGFVGTKKMVWTK